MDNVHLYVYICILIHTLYEYICRKIHILWTNVLWTMSIYTYIHEAGSRPWRRVRRRQRTRSEHGTRAKLIYFDAKTQCNDIINPGLSALFDKCKSQINPRCTLKVIANSDLNMYSSEEDTYLELQRSKAAAGCVRAKTDPEGEYHSR